MNAVKERASHLADFQRKKGLILFIVSSLKIVCTI